ncbi:hypothetical protein [Streptomyces sp. NPDC001380]|uniref:hypothetical protein n=1 Tax=Streptomyces sp. NPDC001380 TaxID=3364566 RepID=UPI0036777494
MNTEELVRNWKQPQSRRGAAADHPSGEIALRTDGSLARRGRLLGEIVNLTGTLTVSIPLTPAPTD